MVAMKANRTKVTRIFDLPVYGLVYFCLIVYSFLVVLHTKDFGFQGDDFWYVSVPFSRGYWPGLKESLLVWNRPLGIFYAFTLFELFGFSRIPYLALDFLLQATTSLFLGIAIHKVFPQRRTLVFFSMLFSFFLLPSASSLSLMTMATARLGACLFWLSVIMFQRWAEKPSWLRMVIPIAFYCLSIMLYDSTSLLIFTVPFFVYPVWHWGQDNPDSSFVEVYKRLFAKIRMVITGKEKLSSQVETAFLVKLAIGLLVCVSFLLIYLFILFPYGMERVNSSFNNLSLLPGYATALFQYVTVPFLSFPFDTYTHVISVVLLVALLVILFREHRSQSLSLSDRYYSWHLYAMIIGLAIVITGIFPFIVSRYGASLGFIGHGRVFFSAIYGIAILFSVALTLWRTDLLRRFFELTGILIIIASAAFLANLRLDWRSAARVNCNLWTSLIEQAPAVQNDTIFLFLNLQSYYQDGKIVPIGNRATVFSSIEALPYYIQMLYGNDSLKAYYLYSSDMDQSILQTEGRIAIVTANGVIARNSLELPKDRIVIFERQNDRLVLVHTLTADDGKAAIIWKDEVNELVSNPDQIIVGNEAIKRYEIIWGRVCN